MNDSNPLNLTFGSTLMKRAISALALASLAASASALTIVATPAPGGSTGITPGAPNATFDVVIPGFSATNGFIGSLSAAGDPGPVKYTYLGKEAAATNTFFNLGGSNQTITTGSAVGTSSYQAATGLLNFYFQSSISGAVIQNGAAGNSEPTFAIFSGGKSGFDYVLGFSDAGAGHDLDYDDMVIGVTAVPEPETYMMMLAGLGAMAFVARRRRPQTGAQG